MQGFKRHFGVTVGSVSLCGSTPGIIIEEAPLLCRHQLAFGKALGQTMEEKEPFAMIAVPAEVFLMETAGGHLHSNVQRLGGSWCIFVDRKASHNAKMVGRFEGPCVLQ